MLANFTITRAYFEDWMIFGMPTAWSLTVEETFYLSAPLLLLGLKHDLRRIVAYPVILLTLGFVLVAFCTRFVPFYNLMGNVRFMLLYTFFGRCAEFIMGMGLAVWMSKQAKRSNSGYAFTLLGAGGIVLFMGVIMVVHHFYHVDGTSTWSFGQIAANNFILPILVCALFWGLITERTQLRRMLETKPFDLLGKSSYVLYLIHGGSVDSMFREYVSSNRLMGIATYIGLSIVIYKYIEHPLHTRLRAKAVPRKVQADGTSVETVLA